jgi:3-phosphoshikimate 1-carboxyvinyltransferase
VFFEVMKLIKARAKNGVQGRVKAPPSKSYTHRALFAASLSENDSKIVGYLRAGDTISTVNSCIAFGAEIRDCYDYVMVRGVKEPKTPEDVIDVENSGTTLRILSSILGCVPYGLSVITGDDSIRRRPMQPLIESLEKLGVTVWSTRKNGCAPLVVKGGGMRGGETEIDCSLSSQYLSSLLISAPLAKRGVTISVKNPVSRPYIDSTVQVLKKFGIDVFREGYTFFRVEPQPYKGCIFHVPGDFSSSSFLLAACILAGGSIVVENLNFSYPQADSKIVEILRKFGVKINVYENSVSVLHSNKGVEGCSINLRDSPDLLPVISVIALRSSSIVEITGVRHARYKETDRITVITTELSKIGAKIKQNDDGLVIFPPRKFRNAILDPQGDHRLFMAFFTASLLGENIFVKSSDISFVSYPQFLSDMKKIGIECEVRQK